MESNYRRLIVVVFTFLGGLYFVFEFLMPARYLEQWGMADKHEAISLGFVAIGLVTIFLGIINLIMIHGSRIAFKRKGWINSIALLLGLSAMIFFSGYDWMLDFRQQEASRDALVVSEFARHIAESEAAEKRPEKLPPFETRVNFLINEINKVAAANRAQFAEAAANETPNIQTARHNLNRSLDTLEKARAELEAAGGKDAQLKALGSVALAGSEVAFLKRQHVKASTDDTFGKVGFKLLFDGFFVALGSAMFSLLGVYIAAAAYRAFRIRTVESSLMMATALIVMLGQIPFGKLIDENIPFIRTWLLQVPNSAVTRAISIGALVAGLVLSFRMWFSIESDKFSQDKK